ncbi:MAG: glycosyltransferase family 2 protein [Acidobacteria bacterium]|nr:glycosyltransferase family 2 protein [Acidobacteriota bacterium]
MTLRPHIVRWILRLYFPPFTWFYRLYYQSAIHLSRFLVSRIKGVRSIYLTGSWARQDVVYGLSDIDFKVLVAGEKDQKTYQAIRRRFAQLRWFFPVLGPPDEKGIYFSDSFNEDYRHHPLVQHLFDARYFRHQLIWGEDLHIALPIQSWDELDQDECTFSRLRDWIERIHILSDYDGLSAPQKQHLFFKAASDIAMLAIRAENPEFGSCSRSESLQHICRELEESFRPFVLNMILENKGLYRKKLNSDDESFRLFKRMVALCVERIARKDNAEPTLRNIKPELPDCSNESREIVGRLQAFSSKILAVRTVRWPQLPLNPFDLLLFDTPAYVVECSEPISLNEFHALKAYCRENLKDPATVLLKEYPSFMSSVDSILVDHWGSFSGSSDLMHFLLENHQAHDLSRLLEKRIQLRLHSFYEQLTAALKRPDSGRMDSGVFPVFLFNALRILIFAMELNRGKWQWLVEPSGIADYLIRHTPLRPAFLHKLAEQYEKSSNKQAVFDERLLPKSRALLGAMMEIVSDGRSWESLEELNAMPDEERLKVSVAIITYNRPKQLERCLISINRLIAPPEEIVIVEDSRAESARDIADKIQMDCPIRCLRSSRPGVAHSRNLAVKAAKGEIVAFVDDDACVTPDWLDRIERAFLRDSRIGLVSGASLNLKCERDDIIWKFMEVVEKI